MKEQIKLFALMQIHKSDFQMLHWKTIGDGFDRFHTNITSGYYEKLDKDIDDVAEVLLRQGVNPPNYFEVVMVLNEDGEKVKFISSKKDYRKTEIISYTDMILKKILNQIIKCLDSDEIKNVKENVGIKSYYEALYNDYDKEYRFLNKRRLSTSI